MNIDLGTFEGLNVVRAGYGLWTLNLKFSKETVQTGGEFLSEPWLTGLLDQDLAGQQVSIRFEPSPNEPRLLRIDAFEFWGREILTPGFEAVLLERNA